MTETETATESTSESPPPANPNPAGPETFEAARRALARGLRAIWEAAEDRGAEIARRTALAVERLNADLRTGCETAYRAHLDGNRPPETTSARRAELTKVYQEAVTKLNGDAKSAYERAETAYRESIDAARKGYFEGCSKVYVEYVRTTQASWASLKAEDLKPESLAAIANSLAAAAQCAALTQEG